MKPIPALRTLGAHRIGALSLLAALSWGCKPTASSPDPTLFQGTMTMTAAGSWVVAGMDSVERGSELFAATCTLDGMGGGQYLASLQMSDDTHVTPPAPQAPYDVVDKYLATAAAMPGFSSATDICRPSLFLGTGEFQVNMDLSNLDWKGGGTTTGMGVTLPLATPADLALVGLTAANEPIVDAIGAKGCVPITGNVVLESGTLPQLHVFDGMVGDNPRAIPISFKWNFVPMNCGTTFDLSGPADLATPTD